MVIINLEKQTKGNRHNLFVDGEFYSGLELDTIVKFGLKNGQEIEKEKLDKLIIDSESFFAFNKALKYISKCMKTESEIKDYLKQKHFKKDVIDVAVKKLYEYKYINDEIYAKNYVEIYKNKYGKLKLKQNLLNKKINEEIIETILNYSEDENLETIKTIIEKQIKNKILDDKLKQKIVRNLISKGFSFEVIKKAFKGLEDENWD